MALPKKSQRPAPQGRGNSGGRGDTPSQNVPPQRPQRPSRPGSRPARPKAPQSVENPYDTEEDSEVFTSHSDRNDEYYYDEDTNDGYDNEYDDVGFDDLEEEAPVPKRKPRKENRPQRRPARNSGDTARKRVRTEPEYDDYDNDDSYDDEYHDDNEHFDSYGDVPSEDGRDEKGLLEVDYDDLDEEESKKMLNRRRAHDHYDVDEEEVAAAANSKRRKASEKKNKNRGFFNSKDKKRKKDKKGADVYVNEKTGKIEPYAKRKIKVSEFDDRKNRQKKATYIQFAVLGLMVILVGAGVKNAVIPPETLTQEEVEAISLDTIGQTNYPEERGRAVAENFIQSYLAVGNGDISSDALDYFYTGTIKNDFDSKNLADRNVAETLSINGGFNQRVVVKPTAYESVSINDNTGYFTVGALVKPSAYIDVDDDEKAPTLSGDEAKWVFFTVNVYYDEKTDMMYVTKDSPSIIPDKDVGAVGDAPDMGIIGNGTEAEDNVQSEISSVIYGYVGGYANASKSNYREVQQYLSSDAADTAKAGLNGDYELAGSPENAITYLAYTTDDPNQLKVQVKVSWLDDITVEGSTESVGSAQYSSNYVATLVKSADGGWLVQNFDSTKFVPEEDASATPAEESTEG